jgi:sn-glycerol 3-phosphate transport system substrate-binding protein
MKNFSRNALGLVLTSLFAGSAFAATSKPAPKPAPSQAVATPAAAGASAEIELVHTLGADKGEQLQKLVDRFNAKTTGPKIVIQDRPWNAGTLPHLMILGERDQQAFLSGATRYRPLHQVMKEAGIKMETLRAPAMMTPTPLDSANRLVALPVGLSTPVMFYNKQAFKEAGLDTENAPPTWQALSASWSRPARAAPTPPPSRPGSWSRTPAPGTTSRLWPRARKPPPSPSTACSR